MVLSSCPGGREANHTGREKKEGRGHRYCDPVWIRQGGNQQERSLAEVIAENLDNCTCFFKTSFILGKPGKQNQSCSSAVFKDGSIASSLQPEPLGQLVASRETLFISLADHSSCIRFVDLGGGSRRRKESLASLGRERLYDLR